MTWAGGSSPARLVVCGGFAALPGDVAAEAGAATLVADEDALRDRLEAEVVGMVEPLVASLEALGRIRARTLWLAAADSVNGTPAVARRSCSATRSSGSARRPG